MNVRRQFLSVEARRQVVPNELNEPMLVGGAPKLVDSGA